MQARLFVIRKIATTQTTTGLLLGAFLFGSVRDMALKKRPENENG